jgi:hypothetical protein
VSDPEAPVAQALRAVGMDIAAKISVAAMQQSDFVPINMIG